MKLAVPPQRQRTFPAFAQGRASPGQAGWRITIAMAVSVGFHAFLLMLTFPGKLNLDALQLDLYPNALTVILRAPQSSDLAGDARVLPNVPPIRRSLPGEILKSTQSPIVLPPNVGTPRLANSIKGASSQLTEPTEPAELGTPSSSAPADAAGRVHDTPVSPQIDLDAAYRIARELGRIETSESGNVVAQRPPIAKDRDAVIRTAFARAARPDCRNAYASMGLLAIPSLLKDTITDSGCKW